MGVGWMVVVMQFTLEKEVGMYEGVIKNILE